MPTLYETILRWADGQNVLNAYDPVRLEALHVAVRNLVLWLHRYASLADLATGYYDDDILIRRVCQEFSTTSQGANLIRDAAYWQRFMEIRHSEKV